jgi:hypothetical protein
LSFFFSIGYPNDLSIKGSLLGLSNWRHPVAFSCFACDPSLWAKLLRAQNVLQNIFKIEFLPSFYKKKKKKKIHPPTSKILVLPPVANLAIDRNDVSTNIIHFPFHYKRAMKATENGHLPLQGKYIKENKSIALGILI